MTSLRILHLTDTHLFGDGSLHYGVVDTIDHLRRALAHVETQQFDVVVCSGDVSEDGSLASYQLARDTVVPWAAERGARVVFAMGNHDQREAFRSVLGEGQPGVDHVRTPRLPGAAARAAASGTSIAPDAAEAAGARPSVSPIVSSATTAGWRWIVLDTSVPGAGYGALGDEQLEFLAAELLAPSQHGTVIVMHHPPVAAQTDLLQALALGDDDAERLWSVVRGTDVRLILSGHYHLPLVEYAHGVPVVVAPGVANLARGFAAPHEESATDGFGGAVIEVTADRVRVAPFERAVSDSEVFHFDANIVRQIVAAAGRPDESAAQDRG